jgi:hypothetical protein
MLLTLHGSTILHTIFVNEAGSGQLVYKTVTPRRWTKRIACFHVETDESVAAIDTHSELEIEHLASIHWRSDPQW